MSTIATRPVWEMSTNQYQAVQGVHRPYIAEISPWQYSSMGKQARRQYDEKRRREWDASGACRNRHSQLVVEAYERGDFSLDDEGVSKDAKTAIYYHKEAVEEAAFAAKMAVAQRENDIGYETDIRVGDRVFNLMGGFYTTVKKVNRKSVKVESRFKGNNVIDGYTYSDADYTTDKRALRWLHHNELVEAVTNDTPIAPR